jgi:hypothetical protein
LGNQLDYKLILIFSNLNLMPLLIKDKFIKLLL